MYFGPFKIPEDVMSSNELQMLSLASSENLSEWAFPTTDLGGNSRQNLPADCANENSSVIHSVEENRDSTMAYVEGSILGSFDSHN
jgi:hypothetical protein